MRFVRFSYYKTANYNAPCSVMRCGALLLAVRCGYAILRAVLVQFYWFVRFMQFGTLTGGNNRFRVKSYCKNFNSLLVDLFTLRIVRSNPPQIFTLKWFVSLVFIGAHICVLFTFPPFA